MTLTKISYKEGDDAFDAVLSLPEGSGPHPAVLVFHAWGGRDDFAEDRARALASLGYIGAAVDLYGVGRRGANKEESAALMNDTLSDPARLRRRLAAAFQAVRTHEAVDPDRVGAIGYCFGGMCAIMAARMGLPLRAVVSFHGLLKVGEPLDGPMHARLLVQHGQDDPMAPPSDVGAFAAEMKRIDADWQLHAYPGVMHAFTNPVAADPDFGTVYDADADARSWRESARFLEDELG